MFRSKYTKHVASFIISWLGLCFIFPLVPGITFTGSIFDGLGLTVLNLLILVALIVVVVIVGLVAGITYAIRRDNIKFSKSDVTAWMLKQGFWKVTIVGSLVSIVLSSLTWKITAGLSSSLTIDGWSSIIIATTITSLISFVPKYLSRPSDYTEEHFREELTATLVKEQAEEAAEKVTTITLEATPETTEATPEAKKEPTSTESAEHKDGDK